MLYVANLDNVHTVKWLRWAVDKGYEVHAASFGEHQLDNHIRGITYHLLKGRRGLGYFLQAKALRQIVSSVEPTIVHAHYASGYGTLARLSGAHPLVLSVWGSDVYEFPRRSIFHRAILIANLKYADWVCSTSRTMAAQVSILAPDIERISVTPFGVNVDQFAPNGKAVGNNQFTIGTVKGLAWVYGIDNLIRAFALLVERYRTSGMQLKLVIAGTGPQENALKNLVSSLNLDDQVSFAGYIPNDKVPQLLNEFDVFVATSRRESFGVAVLEALSCGVPVIVSNIGGLPEIVSHGESGFLVPPDNPECLANTVSVLIDDESLRNKMANMARLHVCKNWDFDDNAQIMEDIYRTVSRRAI